MKQNATNFLDPDWKWQKKDSLDTKFVETSLKTLEKYAKRCFENKDVFFTRGQKKVMISSFV